MHALSYYLQSYLRLKQQKLQQHLICGSDFFFTEDNSIYFLDDLKDCEIVSFKEVIIHLLD